jgi:acyl carrier protein
VADDVERRIAALVAEMTGVIVRDDGATLQDLGVSSLALVRLLIEIEEAFGFLFEDDDLEVSTLSRPGDLAALVAARLASRPAATATDEPSGHPGVPRR